MLIPFVFTWHGFQSVWHTLSWQTTYNGRILKANVRKKHPFNWGHCIIIWNEKFFRVINFYRSVICQEKKYHSQPFLLIYLGPRADKRLSHSVLYNITSYNSIKQMQPHRRAAHGGSPPPRVTLLAVHWCSLSGDVSLCASIKILHLIALFTDPVHKSLQRCQSKMTRVAVTNSLSFLYATVLKSTPNCNSWMV